MWESRDDDGLDNGSPATFLAWWAELLWLETLFSVLVFCSYVGFRFFFFLKAALMELNKPENAWPENVSVCTEACL